MVVTRQQNHRSKLTKSLILQEVINGKPIEEAYKNMCKEREQYALEYTEFEYWYYRFYNGNHDLEHDRSLDPKCRSFSELPIHVLRNITGKLKLENLLSLQKVSRALRTFIDGDLIECSDFCLMCFHKDVELFFPSHSVEYTKVRGGCMVECNRKGKLIKGGNYLKMALNDMKLIIKHPKLKLKKFDIWFAELGEKIKPVEKRCLNYMETVFRSLSHQLHVKKLVITVENLNSVLSILPYCQAGTLEEMDFGGISAESNPTILRNIYDLEQWKRAKKLQMKKQSLGSMENYLHFSFLSLSLDTMTTDDVYYMKNVFLTSANFNCCLLYTNHRVLTTHNKQILGLRPYNSDERNYIFPIPDSNHYYSFTVDEFQDKITIQRHTNV